MTGARRWLALGGALALIAIAIVAIQTFVVPPAPASVVNAPDAPAQRADGPLAPDFHNVTQWINSEPLAMPELRGKVVLVDFWTYTCVNCLRTLPYLRDWHAKYASKGLVMVGVHSPEFEFEKDEARVREAVSREGVAWAVAMDNDFGTWRAYQNRYWPHKFLIDKDGVIRYHHIGEGAYLETEEKIREYLTEAGYDVSGIPLGQAADEVNDDGVITREIYAGYGWGHGGYLGNPVPALPGQTTQYVDGGKHLDGRFHLHGTWMLDKESALHRREAEGFEDYVALRYTAASVNAVIHPEGEGAFLVRVTLDDNPLPQDRRGDDIKFDQAGNTYFEVDGSRLYNIVKGPQVESRELKLRMNSPDFRLYTFTFGR